MVKKVTDIGILLLERDQWKYYIPSLEAPAVLKIGSELISDLEIVSKSGLDRQFHNWLEQAKIPCLATVVILSDTLYFEHTLPPKASEGYEQELNNFLDLVPLDDKHISQFALPDLTRVFVSNMEILQSVITLLRQCDVSIHAVLPISEIKFDYANSKPREFSEYIKLNLPTLKTFNLLAEAEYKEAGDDDEAFYSFKLSPKIFAMAGLFLLLMGLLFFLIRGQQQENARVKEERDKNDAAQTAPAVTPAPVAVSPSPQATPVSTATSQELTFEDELTMTFSYVNVRDELYLEIKEELQLVFPNATSTQTAATNTRSLITVPASLNDEKREVILTIVKKFDAEVSIQENAELENDTVLIRLKEKE